MGCREGVNGLPRNVGSRGCRLIGRLSLVALAAGLAEPAVGQQEPRSAKAESTRLLLERLEERRMPDVALWVIDRLEKDPDAPADLKAELGFRRGVALVGASRRESDSAKRGLMFDEAQKQLDAFLATATGSRTVDGFFQKGNLLIERGRTKLAEAERPGADATALRKQAVPFFDAAIAALEGTVKGKDDQLPEKIANAEDAVVRELRRVGAELDALKAEGGDKESSDGKKLSKRDRARQLELVESQQETWQGKLVQTRLMVASAWYEKARAFAPQSDDWKKALEESTERFKGIAEKYPTLGGGFFARFYQGRNQFQLGKPDDALQTLLPLVTLEGQSDLARSLRRKALTTTVECWLAKKKFGDFTPELRKFILGTVPPAQLDEDWLGLKLRTAQLLEAQAGVAAEKDKAKARPLLQDAKKLALVVARANREFASEARELLGRIGADVPDDEPRTFSAAFDEARQAVAAMQRAAAEAKAAADAGAKAAALERAAQSRLDAIGSVRAALRQGSAEEIDQLNQARYLLTYLMYDAGRYHEAALLGRFLAERYPNAKGSRQAATIAMASWQQLQRQADAAWADDAKAKGVEMAERIMKIWSADKEAGDAALVALQNLINTRDAAGIIGLVAQAPASSPRRPEMLLRAGAALWSQVPEQRKREGGTEQAAALKRQATAYLDEGFAAAQSLAVSTATVNAALARSQIAMDDGDTPLALKWLDDPRHGPWTVVQDPAAAATLREGPVAEAALSAALRCFVEAEALDRAQQAMTRLEQLAGDGQESAARLTAMYFTMGQELQAELESLARDDGGDRTRARTRARAILGGFEKFLEGVAKRDKKPASQIWVASTYLTLGSGSGTGSIVPPAEAAKYLDRASAVFGDLLARVAEPEVAKFEPALRLKTAEIHSQRGRYAEAEKEIDWLLADKRRQNTPDLQVQAARMLQAAGERLATADPEAADEKFRQATVGRKAGESVVWGWGGIANRLAKQAVGGEGERAAKSREQFFEARLNIAACLLRRATLGNKQDADKNAQLDKAAASIDATRRLYPDLGGKASAERFERLEKQIQKERG